MTVEPATIAEVRAWATARGLTFATRGRLSRTLLDAFTAETGRAIASLERPL